MVDFEDVVKIPEEFSLITQDVKFRGQFRRINNLTEYLEDTFGEGLLGELAGEFQEGFMGRETTTQEVARQVLEYWFGK